jgi:arylsulfatase A
MSVSRREFIQATAFALGSMATGARYGISQAQPAVSDTTATAGPNIVIILADDLGYGDLSCYGAEKARTPRIDGIARDGILFTDAHAPSPLCTPTRYGLLTGEYYWRIGPTRGRQWNMHRQCLIAKDQLTVASLLRTAGYATACIGKWHLGFGEETPDWNGELKPGPLEAGFDYYFGVPNANSEAPFAFVENHRIVGLKPGDPIRIPGESRGDYRSMEGGAAARWIDEEIAHVQTGKAVSFIEAHRDQPFLLYFAPCNVHVPLTPHERFKGTSDCGVYGDFIHELDWSVGQVLDTLERHGLRENTLVVFSSDNGGVLHREAMAAGHRANGPLHGQKTDVWEGGHRVPFVAQWPGRITPGSRSTDIVCLTDMLATTAALLGKDLPHEAGPDSFNILPALLDQSGHTPPRDSVIMGWPGWAIRQGPWLYIPHQGSGGVTTDPTNKAGEGWMNLAEIGDRNSDYMETGELKADAPPAQLYNLVEDPGETTNLYAQHPDIVARLSALLKKHQDAGRSRS